MLQSTSPFIQSLRKFFHNPMGLMGAVIILLAIVVSIFAYALMPDDSNNANSMDLSLSTRSPGFQIFKITIPSSEIGLESKTLQFIEYKFVGASLKVTLHPSKEEIELTAQDLGLVEISASSLEHFITTTTFWLGTDKYGRDLLSRIILGTRISLAVGAISVFISLLVGILLGSLGGYFEGRTDAIISWVINVVWSIPTLLLVIAITLALGKGFWQVFVAVGLTMWVEVARVVRGQMLSVKRMEYVEAAKVLGYSDLRIIWKHILPNILGPVIVIAAANFAAAILIEAGLSFLGIGAQPPTPSWGGIIKDHYAYIVMDKAYLALYPGLAIMFVVLAFIMIGNALRDALDVKS
ncbi:MAG: peptide/nickel transport system permease protein [Flavobacteriales bacterium]|jgi:peptide/nickel transport system permease protein